MYKFAKTIIAAIYSSFDNENKGAQQAKHKKEKIFSSLDKHISSKNATKSSNSIAPTQEQLSNLKALYNSGQYSETEKLAVYITQSFPEHQLAWKVLGVIFHDSDRLDDSLVASQKSAQLAPQDAKAQLNLGVTLKTLGRIDEAVSCFKQATSLNSEFALAHFNLGIALHELGRFHEAEESHSQAIALKPDFAEAHSNLGNTLEELRRLDEAEASYTQAIVLKPDFAQAHNNLGATLQRRERLDQAEVSFRKAIALKPDYVNAISNLGNVLYQLDRLGEAEAMYAQAIRLKPDYTEAHNYLGTTQWKLGKFEDAKESYTQALVFKPDYGEALTNRSYLLFEKGEYEAALRDADACNFSTRSRVLPFISLYALNRASEIYERLELQSKCDAENISIAAFAAFISEVEGKPTANNFCPNPIDFIHITNLSSHVNDSVAYSGGLIEELKKMETIWEPYEKSTISGFQTPTYINLFKHPTGKINQLKSIIINEIHAYCLKYQNQDCSYMQKFPTPRNLFGWSVVLKQQGHQKAHIHSGGWLSGVIYLKVVPSLGKHEGAIEFSLNGEHYHHPDSPCVIFQPEVGDMVFFPSSLHHRTIPFSTDAERIIVSFDLIPEVARNLGAGYTQK